MKIAQKPVDQVVKDNMLGYSAYVLLDRALPDIRDGLKPVYRRILYAMLHMKAFNFTKSANCSGHVMKFHPHGDSYPTMVHMVQKDTQNIPLLVGKGNFAQHTSRDMAPGAPRYTEVKLSEVATEMLSNLEKGLIDFVPNYDGTIKMPEVLPVKFPVALTQINIGIGVGFSSSSPSFNLKELSEAIIWYLESGIATHLYPDFPTGGFINKDSAMIKQINFTGSGSVRLRAKAEIIGNEIAITEIPYTTTREAIIDKVEKLAKEGKFKEIVDIKDLTGLAGQLIEIRCRRNTDMQAVLNKLYKLTPLESSFSANMNMLVDNLPKVMGVWNVIDHWLNWRRECILKGLRYDVDKMKKQLHLLRGLERVLLDIDAAIEIIRHSAEARIIPTLMKQFTIDELQANEVANMKLRHINRDHILKKIAEIKQLEKKIAQFEKIMQSEKALNQIIAKGLTESAEKYGTPRRTKIVEMNEIGKITFDEPEAVDYPVIIQVTKDGYAYKSRTDRQATLKAGDKLINIFTTTNSAELLVFTENGDCHKVRLNDISETKAGAFGTYLPTIIDDNNIVGYSVLDNKHTFIINVFENKKVAKIDLQSFIGNRKKLKNSLYTGAKLIDILTFEKPGSFDIIGSRFTLLTHTDSYTLSSSRSAQGAVCTTKKGEIVSVKKA